MSNSTDTPDYANYVVGFVDLLGQRQQYVGQGLLPQMMNGSMPPEFIEVLHRTIGPISDLQVVCDMHLKEQHNLYQAIRNHLPIAHQPVFDGLHKSSLKCQRWSDGIVYFQSIAKNIDDVPMSGVYGIIAVLGALCSLGLAKKAPVRGGLEIGWGVELKPGEIYGAAVACAYELESKKAKWPRIVVGGNMVKFLGLAQEISPRTVFDELNRKLAEVVLSWVEKDIDGEYFLHYLGRNYRKYAGHPRHDEEIVPRIRSFIAEQLSKWQAEGNAELAKRYKILSDYYGRNI